MSITVTSFNCKGFKERNDDFIKLIFDKSVILLLQETWLYTFEHEKIGQIMGNDALYFAKSAMQDTDIGRLGRPFGGCAVVCRSHINMSITPLETQSNRLCAVHLKNSINSIILISVYMPCNDGSVMSFNEYIDVLVEISSILHSYSDSKTIIGGDFNTDLDRESNYSLYLKQFLNSENLLCSSVVFNDKSFTYQSSMGAKSSIDHFLYFESCFDYFIDYKVFKSGINLSDHNPIFITFKIEEFGFFDNSCFRDSSIDQDINDECKYKWKDATLEQIKLYKDSLTDILSSISLPSSVLKCTDVFCESHHDLILEHFDTIINSIILATEIAIPKSKNKNKNTYVGWNDMLNLLKKNLFSGMICGLKLVHQLRVNCLY